MVWLALVVVALGACGGHAPALPDAMPDAAPPADAQVCFGAYGYCLAAPPTGELVLRDTIDTDTDPRCAPATVAACIVAAHDIVISQALTISGVRPLALIGRSIQVDGAIGFVKSRGVASACAAPTAPAPRAGRAGGSFATAGGRGGASGAGPGGVPPPAGVPAELRGGCPGDNADASSGLTAGGLGLIATDRVTLFAGAFIEACGTGGLGAPKVPNGDGGGGGGSGGMVLFDAPVVELDGTVLAIGGGGGAGSTTTTAGDYGATSCGNATQTTAPGGGTGGGFGGAGGTSSHGGNGTTDATGGGGGGGGGAGIILVHGTQSGMATLVPPATMF